MAFGSEILLLVGAGFVVLGPRRMQTMLGQLGRAKAQFDRAKDSLMSEITNAGEEKHRPNPCAAEENKGEDSGLVLPDDLIERIIKRRTASA